MPLVVLRIAARGDALGCIKIAPLGLAGAMPLSLIGENHGKIVKNPNDSNRSGSYSKCGGKS